MSVTIIRVNPESVVSYGRDAQERFDSIRNELKTLVSAVAEVRYFGPNAVSFKTNAAQLSADFANRFNRDLGGIANSIRTTTTNIAAALGGQPISISVNGTPIDVPTIANVNYVDVDLTALEGLERTVNQHFARIVELVDGHLKKLESTDWAGNAREKTVDAVRQFTSSSKSSCNEVQQMLSRTITEQIRVAREADQGSS